MKNTGQNFPLIREFILAEKKRQNVVIADDNGFRSISLKLFVRHSTDSILYYLNRDEVTALTWLKAGDSRGVNDYATAQVISQLKDEITELKKEIQDLRNERKTKKEV